MFCFLSQTWNEFTNEVIMKLRSKNEVEIMIDLAFCQNAAAMTAMTAMTAVWKCAKNLVPFGEGKLFRSKCLLLFCRCCLCSVFALSLHCLSPSKLCLHFKRSDTKAHYLPVILLLLFSDNNINNKNTNTINAPWDLLQTCLRNDWKNMSTQKGVWDV